MVRKSTKTHYVSSDDPTEIIFPIVENSPEFRDQGFLTEKCEFDDHRIRQIKNTFPSQTIFKSYNPDSKADWISDEWICFPSYPFTIGFKYPFSSLTSDFFSTTGLNFFQAMPMVWRVLRVLENLNDEGGPECGVEELAYCYDVRSHGHNCFLLKVKPKMAPLVFKVTKNSLGWKNNFFFVKRTSIEGGDTLPKEWVTKAFQFSDLAPAVKETALRVSAILKIDIKRKSFGPIVLEEGSSETQTPEHTMSTESRRTSRKISYDDVSSLINKGGIGKERASPRFKKPPIAKSPRPSSATEPIQESPAKKRKSIEAEDSSSSIFHIDCKKLQATVQQLINHYSSIEKRNQELELIVKNKDELIKERVAISIEHARKFKELEKTVELMKDAQEEALEIHAQELKNLSLQHSKALKECLDEATASTAIFVLKDRIQFVKEAKEKGADVSLFDVEAWEKSLANLQGEEDEAVGSKTAEGDAVDDQAVDDQEEEGAGATGK